MSLKFYTDTHISKQVAIQLRQRGIDFVRCEEVGMAEADDEAHLTYAAQEGRILITFDKGFRNRAFNWIATGEHHSGVFIVTHSLQGTGGIGLIVRECLFYHEAVEVGAGTIDEFRDQVIRIG